MFVITESRTICSSHCEEAPGGGLGPLHGHNWRIVARAEASTLDAAGLVLPEGALGEALWRVVEPLDHRHLNDLAPFEGSVPTPPRVARWVFEQLGPELSDGRIRLRSIEVWTASEQCASWEPPQGP